MPLSILVFLSFSLSVLSTAQNTPAPLCFALSLLLSLLPSLLLCFSSFPAFLPLGKVWKSWEKAVQERASVSKNKNKREIGYCYKSILKLHQLMIHLQWFSKRRSISESNTEYEHICLGELPHGPFAPLKLEAFVVLRGKAFSVLRIHRCDFFHALHEEVPSAPLPLHVV